MCCRSLSTETGSDRRSMELAVESRPRNYPMTDESSPQLLRRQVVLRSGSAMRP